MKVVVVGAGIAGSSVVRACRAKGYEVEHIAAADLPGSLAATAVLRRSYHQKSPADLKLWSRSMELYKQWGVQQLEGAEVTSYQKPGAKLDRDWRMIDPADPLVRDNIRMIRVVKADGKGVVLDNHQRIAGDKVVCCVGADSSNISTGKLTVGVTWIGNPSLLVRKHLRVHYLAPYKTLTAGVINGKARLGSSSATTLQEADRQAYKMLKQAVELGIATTDQGWMPLLGYRIQADQRSFQHRNGYHVLTGYHRTGYALAPAEAEELVNSW